MSLPLGSTTTAVGAIPYSPSKYYASPVVADDPKWLVLTGELLYQSVYELHA